MNTTAAITLTADQQNALDAFFQFLVDPEEHVFVLSGFSGCGKTTLVRELLDHIPKYFSMAKLVYPKFKEYAIALTATTNKAAENLGRITGADVSTIHSALGLMVRTDYSTGKTSLAVNPRRRDQLLTQHLLVVDEGSYVDSDLLGLIFKRTQNCKILFVGDPAQLAPVKSSSTPVFDAGFKGAALTEVVRQAKDNPIIDLSTKFRHTVTTGEWLTFKPDGNSVIHLDHEDFLQAIEQEFTRPDWQYLDSKVLAWTNKAVQDYNHHINTLVKGVPHFQIGDYAVCNSYVQLGKTSIKTDQLVEITDIGPEHDRYGALGRLFTLNGSSQCFMPNSLEERKKVLTQARKDESSAVFEIEESWIDLRAAYAQTVNKAQGSTYDKVFINLTDISKCTNGNALARMLYVAVSRARTQVFLTGDIN